MERSDKFTGEGVEAHIEHQRISRDKKLRSLNAFSSGYTVDMFCDDLNAYFDGEVDFNMDKVKEVVSAQGALDALIEQAFEDKTHPVSVFIRNMFKDSSK